MNLLNSSVWIQKTIQFMTKTRTKRLENLVLLVLGTVYLLILERVPLSTSLFALHDDALFLRLSTNIVLGNWLGPFDELTLAKGPGYSLFLVLSAATGISVVLLTGGFLFVALLLVSRQLRLLGVGTLIRLGVVALALLQPAYWPSRILRDVFYAALILILLAAVFALVNFFRNKHEKKLFWETAGLCFIGGIAFITREESLLLAPLLLIPLAVFFFYRSSFRKRFVQVAILAGIAALPTIAISTTNSFVYGFWGVTEFNSGHFSDALSAVQRVEADSYIDKVPVSKLARNEIYLASPSFRNLEPFLENPSSKWLTYGCEIYPDTCGDIAGGWFMWAFREAASQAGYYQDAKTAETFYSNVAREVNDACESGELDCKDRGFLFLPETQDTNIFSSISSQLFLGFADLTYSSFDDQVPLTQNLSRGPVGYSYTAATYLGSPYRSALEQERAHFIRAKVTADLLSEIDFYSYCDSSGYQGSVSLLRPGGVGAEEFELHLESPNLDKCGLVVAAPNYQERISSLDLSDRKQRSIAPLGLTIISLGTYMDQTALADLPSNIVLSSVSKVFAALQPGLIVLASVFLIIWFYLIIRRGLRKLSIFDFFIIALVGLLGARYFALATISAISFPAMSVSYLGVIYAFIPILFGALLQRVIHLITPVEK